MISNRFVTLFLYLLVSGLAAGAALSTVRAADDTLKFVGISRPTFRLSEVVTEYHYGLFSTSFNPEDIFTGFQFGVSVWAKGRLSVVGGFDWRTSAKRVLVPIDDQTYFQFQERRYFPNIGVEKRFQLNDILGFFLTVRTGYLVGDYKATRRDTDDGFVVWPSAGVSLNFAKIIHLRGGYQYQNVRNQTVSPHRAYIGLGIAIHKKG